MDRYSVRPRYYLHSDKKSAVHTARLEQEPHKNIVVAELPPRQNKLQKTSVALLQEVQKMDFSAGAKAHKKKKLTGSVRRGFAISGGILTVLILVVGAFGAILNHKYSGRALPFTYVGNLSVGGLTQEQIKKALDQNAKNMEVTFVDGGLKKTVPVSLFGAKFDTETASKQAVTGFNPFAFLDRRSIDMPVSLNDYQVDGYLRLNIHPTQSKAENAEIIKNKNNFAIKQEIQGFRSDPKFVAERIKIGMASLSNPIINLNAATLKPEITAADLNDDIVRANNLLNTNVTVSYFGYTTVITPTQKMSWISFSDASGGKDIKISFSKSLVRDYILSLAKQYQKPVKIDPKQDVDGQKTNAVLQAKNPIENIEEVADNIVAALNSGQATSERFITKTDSEDVLSSSNFSSQLASRQD